MYNIKRRKVECKCPKCKGEHVMYLRCAEDHKPFIRLCSKCKNRSKKYDESFIHVSSGHQSRSGGKET